MQLINLRLGHATNSSSTHSIIMTKRKLHDSMVDDGFGWDHFTAASKEAKDLYFASCVRSALDRTMNPALVDAILKGLDLPTKTEDIDHQSRLTLPLEYGGRGINMKYAAELRKFLLRDDVAILGGNDNENTGHPDYIPGESTFIPTEYDNAIARKDGKVWTIYNGKPGDRISFVFGKNEVAKFKPKTPFLIDLKITDYCEANCNFCYQGSGRSGKHAGGLWGTLYEISKAKVFEVAIGGGEPTMHPEFLRTLQIARDFGITPNFSTKNLDGVSDKAIELCGAFAYSATSVENAKKAAGTFGETGKLVLQVVPGIMGPTELENILLVACDYHLPVTLLGYKQVGRATTPSTTEASWIDVVKKVTEKLWLTLGIDTTLAARYAEELKGFDKRTFHVEEGLYSMYIDAVTKMCGPSSYQKDKLFKYNGDVENCFRHMLEVSGDSI